MRCMLWQDFENEVSEMSEQLWAADAEVRCECYMAMAEYLLQVELALMALDPRENVTDTLPSPVVVQPPPKQVLPWEKYRLNTE